MSSILRMVNIRWKRVKQDTAAIMTRTPSSSHGIQPNSRPAPSSITRSVRVITPARVNTPQALAPRPEVTDALREYEGQQQRYDEGGAIFVAVFLSQSIHPQADEQGGFSQPVEHRVQQRAEGRPLPGEAGQRTVHKVENAPGQKNCAAPD